MRTANPSHQSVISFETDVSLVTTLLADLQHEQTALVSADLDFIEKMVDQRAGLLQALAAAAQQRYDALAAAGFDASEVGMANWLAGQANPVLEQAWQRFQKQLAQARELNRLNGVLINRQFQRNQEKLDALHGKTAAPQLYGKNGQAHATQQGRASFSV